jgi:cardiolipin synthase
VVDGSVAFTGGLNLSREYAHSSSHRASLDTLSQGWRDTHVAIRGPAVEGFELAFEEQWALQEGSFAEEPLSGVTFEAAGSDLVAVLQAEGGDEEVSPIYRAYLEAMRTAADRIWITQAYFAPDEEFMRHINNAVARGVDVRLLVPGQSDSKLLLNASRSRYGKLLEHGVKIYESRISILHAKTAVIDGIWSTVGSSNLDYRSFLHNDEINAIILGTDFARQMEARFQEDLENSQQVTLETWSDRSLGDRIKEFFSWMFAYWL